jgi:hypothetical protein
MLQTFLKSFSASAEPLMPILCEAFTGGGYIISISETEREGSSIGVHKLFSIMVALIFGLFIMTLILNYLDERNIWFAIPS